MNEYYKTDIDAEFCLIDCGILRDTRGRFLPGHKILSPRDTITGRFVSVESMEKQDDKYSMVRREVDRLLDIKFKTAKQLLEENGG